MKRVQSELGVDAETLAAQLQPHFKDPIDFTIGGTRRSGDGQPKLGKEVLAQASAALRAGKGDVVADMLAQRNPGLTFTRAESDYEIEYDAPTEEDPKAKRKAVISAGQVTHESLAAGIRADNQRVAAEQKAAFADLLK